MGRGVGPHRQMSRVHRGINEPGGRIEYGMDIAPAGPSIAGAPAVTLAPILVVLQPVGGDAGAIRRQDLSRLLHALAQLHLTPVELRGTLELAGRQVRQGLLASGDAGGAVDLVVGPLPV